MQDLFVKNTVKNKRTSTHMQDLFVKNTVSHNSKKLTIVKKKVTITIVIPWQNNL